MNPLNIECLVLSTFECYNIGIILLTFLWLAFFTQLLRFNYIDVCDYTAGPWMCHFDCHFIIMLGGIVDPGLQSTWSLYVLPMSAWTSLLYSGFLPQPKDVHITGTGVSSLTSGSVGGCEGVLWSRASCPGLLPICHPELWERLWPPLTLYWNKQVGK